MVSQPASGYYTYSGDTKPYSKTTHGGIWTYTLYKNGEAWYMGFDSSGAYNVVDGFHFGMPVRPVIE